jgi:hypothetical protein
LPADRGAGQGEGEQGQELDLPAVGAEVVGPYELVAGGLHEGLQVELLVEPQQYEQGGEQQPERGPLQAADDAVAARLVAEGGGAQQGGDKVGQGDHPPQQVVVAERRAPAGCGHAEQWSHRALSADRDREIIARGEGHS